VLSGELDELLIAHQIEVVALHRQYLIRDDGVRTPRRGHLRRRWPPLVQRPYEGVPTNCWKYFLNSGRVVGSGGWPCRGVLSAGLVR
jgi:hypothetical protein